MPNVSSQSLAAPQVATYKNIRVPFVGSLSQREGHSTNKDLAITNFLLERVRDNITEQETFYLHKRPGTINLNTLNPGTMPSSPSGEGRGIFLWKDNGIYSVFGDTLYRNATSIQTLATSTGKCGFVLATGATPYLFFCDGTNAYYISSSGTVNTATGEPSPHIPTPVFIDGYIFLAEEGTADIFNCDLEDPGTWNSSNFITAEMFPDNIVALARQNNQVVALGEESCQFFYDAGNATGTPLAVTPNTAIQFGCSNYETVTQAEQLLTWVSQSETGGRAVWTLDGFEAKKISNEAIERIISIYQANPQTAMNIRVNGHFLYVLSRIDGERTLVYDYDEKTWSYWGSDDGAGVNEEFHYVHSSSDDDFGVAILQSLSFGKVVQLYQRMFVDDSDDIICTIRTDPIDLGNGNRKFMYNLRVISDYTFYGGTTYNAETLATTLPLEFRYNDKDYSTTDWSSWKSIDLVTQPYYKVLGSFRRRAFEFKFSEPYPLRMEAMEFDINQGMH